MADVTGNTLVLETYDSLWPVQADLEQRWLRLHLGPEAQVEHVGSTSIPGMTGRPIIDLVLGLTDMDAVEHTVTDLQNLGYERDSDGPGWSCCSRPGYHLYLTVYGDAFWWEALRFRERLRSNHVAADEYARSRQGAMDCEADVQGEYERVKTACFDALQGPAEAPD